MLDHLALRTDFIADCLQFLVEQLFLPHHILSRLSKENVRLCVILDKL